MHMKLLYMKEISEDTGTLVLSFSLKQSDTKEYVRKYDIWNNNTFYMDLLQLFARERRRRRHSSNIISLKPLNNWQWVCHSWLKQSCHITWDCGTLINALSYLFLPMYCTLLIDQLLLRNIAVYSHENFKETRRDIDEKKDINIVRSMSGTEILQLTST